MQCFHWCITNSTQPIDTQTEAQVQNYEGFKKKNAMCKRNTTTHQNIQIRLVKSYSFNLIVESELQIKQSIIKHSLTILTHLQHGLNIIDLYTTWFKHIEQFPSYKLKLFY